MRVKSSEGERLLRQWWSERGDYMWLVEFLAPRGFLGGIRAVVGTGGVLMGLALVCLYYEHLNPPGILSHLLVAAMATACFAWAVYWWFFPWPSARLSAVLFAFADIGIALATVVHANALTALATTPLFAMTGAFIVFFYGPRANAVHIVFATVTIVGTATWLALSGQPDAVPVAISKAVISLTVTVGIFPFVQFGFWLVRSNAVESLTDPLTDLANRRGLSNYLNRRLSKLTSSAEPLCALVIDLDGFKNINDEHGHKIGDAVITRTGEQIRAAVRSSAFVARTGGEEFVVVDLLTLEAGAGIAEGIRVAIEALSNPKATASIGVAVGRIEDAAEFDAIHACADEAMYAAKRDGGNRIALGGVVHPPDAGPQRDEFLFRPTELSDQDLGPDPLLSADGV
jgi:diguanylate cyclase (GGDEF)-like protein